MNKEKLIKCGCGGEAIIYINGARQAKIYCEKCGIESNVFATKNEAIEAWNRAMGERTAKVETVEKPNVYKCAECGQYFHSTAWGSPVEYCSRCGAKLDWSGNDKR